MKLIKILEIKKYVIFFVKNHLQKRRLSNNIVISRLSKIHASSVLDTSGGGIITVGNNTEILNGCLLMTYGGRISIGENCSINPYTILYGHGNGLIIGNNVLIAGHCLIIPSNHKFTDKTKPINTQGEISKGIIIEDDVWIGSGCQVLDGVIIRRGTIVAAGSVINRSTNEYSIMGGVPAKLIRQR
jgi:acetyltransferase-like isoleucine patch superfamily enzyme